MNIKVGVFKFVTIYKFNVLLGLAESLRNELLLYGIDVHCYFAGSIDSPGLQQEVNLKLASCILYFDNFHNIRMFSFLE